MRFPLIEFNIARAKTKLSTGEAVEEIALSNVPPTPRSKSSVSNAVHPVTAKLSEGNDNQSENEVAITAEIVAERTTMVLVRLERRKVAGMTREKRSINDVNLGDCSLQKDVEDVTMAWLLMSPTWNATLLRSSQVNVCASMVANPCLK